MRNAKLLALTAACLVCGFGFYRMNHGDVLNTVIFTVALMGIMLSVMRQKSSP
jgi:uncharacterized membrane protein YbaN (DUF454 family)